MVVGSLNRLPPSVTRGGSKRSFIFILRRKKNKTFVDSAINKEWGKTNFIVRSFSTSDSTAFLHKLQRRKNTGQQMHVI
jgi:hypothetical protein